jgi:hypothetical protein
MEKNKADLRHISLRTLSAAGLVGLAGLFPVALLRPAQPVKFEEQ